MIKFERDAGMTILRSRFSQIHYCHAVCIETPVLNMNRGLAHLHHRRINDVGDGAGIVYGRFIKTFGTLVGLGKASKLLG